MFQGTGIALVTPFKEDLSVDYTSLEKLIESVISGGVNFLVALGSTGETPTLSPKERLEVLNFILKINNKRLPVVAGISSNNTQLLLDTIKEYPQDQLAAILSSVPNYNKPGQEGIYLHFKALAEATSTNIILYNVPGRTSKNLEATTAIRLARDFKNIIGIKEASGDLNQCMELVKNAPEGFDVLSGDDPLIIAQMGIGFKGVVSVAGNAYPKTFSEIMQLAVKGDLAGARRLHYQMLDAIHLMFAEGNPTGVKALLHLKGICKNILRLPLVPATDELTTRISKFKDIL